MSDLTVYEKPTCTTCRNLFTLLEERGIDFERVNYHVDPLPEERIRELVRKTGGSAADLLRKVGRSDFSVYLPHSADRGAAPVTAR